MKNIKRVLVVLAIALSCGAFGASAQIYVKVRPEVPRFERPVAPSPRHIWVGEEWEPRGGAYVFVGGHWAEPPHPGWGWIPGHWKRGPRGDFWVAGHWRRR